MRLNVWKMNPSVSRRSEARRCSGTGVTSTLSMTIQLNQRSDRTGDYSPVPGATANRTVTLGPFKGHGHRPELEFAGAQVFVMPGPYERADRVTAALEQLPGLLAE